MRERPKKQVLDDSRRQYKLADINQADVGSAA